MSGNFSCVTLIIASVVCASGLHVSKLMSAASAGTAPARMNAVAIINLERVAFGMSPPWSCGISLRPVRVVRL